MPVLRLGIWYVQNSDSRRAIRNHGVTIMAQLLLLFIGIAAFVGGLVLAILAARGATDGFEDQDGFHVGRAPEATTPKSAHPSRESLY